jgi:hypothetical protein
MLNLSKLFRAEVTLTEDGKAFNVPIDSITAYKSLYDKEDFDEAKDDGEDLTRVAIDCKNFDSYCNVTESREEIAALIEKAENERAEKVRRLNFGIR